jgi:hypothetical protein
VVENEVAADCTNNGSYDNVTYCTVCDAEISRETITVPAKGHIDVDDNNQCDICHTKLGKAEAPVIGIPDLASENVFGFYVDYDAKRIYIDAVKTGLTIDEFVKQLSVSVFNDSDNKAEILVANGTETLTGTALIRTGAQVVLTAENEDGVTTVKYNVVVIGDVNCNGEIDSGDSALIQRYFFKEVELNELQIDAADTNRSGEIESGDAVKNQVKYTDAENYQSNLHSYTQRTSNNDATCHADGTMTWKCTASHNCDAETIVLPEAGTAKRHSYVIVNGAYACESCGKAMASNV